MNESNQKIVNKILTTFLIIASIVAVMGFLVDAKNTIEYGGVDLRQRVVGARLLLEGQDPYHFKWMSGMSELLLDPLDNKDWTVSRVSVTPTVLIFHSIIASFPYLIQKILWFILQWTFLLSTIGIFATAKATPIKRKLLLIIGLLFFSGSYFWRYHVDRLC